MSKFPENAQMRTSLDFAKRLKRIMDDNDCLSNKQFAEFVGVSTPVISKAVNFGIIPSSRLLIKIADKLNLPLQYLLGLSDKSEFVAAASSSSFAVRIEELVKEKEINFGQLAFHIGFPRTYIYEWIQEGTFPSVEYILDMAKYFDISPDYLLGRTDFRQ